MPRSSGDTLGFTLVELIVSFAVLIAMMNMGAGLYLSINRLAKSAGMRRRSFGQRRTMNAQVRSRAAGLAINRLNRKITSCVGTASVSDIESVASINLRSRKSAVARRKRKKVQSTSRYDQKVQKAPAVPIS